jgi:transposase
VNKIICGLDVSKRWLDAGIDTAQVYQRFANSAEGIAELVAFCALNRASLVVMEATGGHERQAFMLLWVQNIPCATVNPRQVRRFAEALGLFEKTDRIDAMVLARFGEAHRTQPQLPPSTSQQRLRRLSTRLSQISCDISLHKQRLATADDDEVRVSLGEVLALLKRQSKSLQGEINSIIDDDPLWSKLDTACRSLKGVADKTVTLLLADLPELGIYGNKAITKLVGLAPMADDSGERQGKRSIRGGRANVRSILYLIGQCVRKYHSGLAAFCERLESKGKEKMVIRLALARKILVMLNARARDARAEYASAA